MLKKYKGTPNGGTESNCQKLTGAPLYKIR